jgi:hypothetical protein
MNNNDPILNELAQAGQVSPVSPLLQTLDKYRIATNTVVPNEEFLFRMFGRPCFPRRDLTTVTGVEKCGKTFFSSMLMACCAERQVLALERIREEPLKVMWYDTEQSRQSTKGILTGRVAKLVKGDFPEGNFLVFNVRSCGYQKRLDMLLEGINVYCPDMVIIDNVSDLLSNINDSDESQKLIEQLMQVATLKECNIVAVIHLNRSGDKRNLRGWLGTELLHKSFDVYNCEQLLSSDVFSVEQTLSRKYHIPENLYYRISDEGLPVISSKPDVQGHDEQGRFTSNRPEAYQVSTEKTDTFNQSYIIRHQDNARTPWEWNLRKLFDDAMEGRAMMAPDDLQDAVMRLARIKAAKYYDKVYRLAVDRRIVQSTLNVNGRVVVIPLPA